MSRTLKRATGILLAAAALAACAAVIVPRLANPPMTLTAQFEDSIGLYEGNEVSVLGMPVGKVTSIAPQGGYVEVKLSIDQNVDIPADAQAVTVSTSVLTDRHIELTPAYSSGPKLKNGDTLSLNRTRTPVEFDRTLAMVEKLSAALRGDGNGQGPLADMIAIGNAITAGNGTNTRAALDQLSQALRLSADNGTHSRKQIQSIVANLADLTQASADNDTTIREFGSTLRRLSDILVDEDFGTGSTGTKINEILAQAAAVLEKNSGKLKDTVADYQTVTKAMTDYRREVAEFFDVAPLAADNAYNAIDSNNGLLRVHGLIDKTFFNDQMAKEICNLIGLKQLGCATGTLSDYGPDFGLTGMLELMGGAPR